MFRLLLAMVLVLAVHPAGARPPETLDGITPEIGDYYRGLRQPASGASCCNEADCRAVDYRITPNGYEAFIAGAARQEMDIPGGRAVIYHDTMETFPGGTDQWEKVPQERVLHRPNPTGRATACWDNAVGFFCFNPPSES